MHIGRKVLDERLVPRRMDPVAVGIDAVTVNRVISDIRKMGFPSKYICIASTGLHSFVSPE